MEREGLPGEPKVQYHWQNTHLYMYASSADSVSGGVWGEWWVLAIVCVASEHRAV